VNSVSMPVHDFLNLVYKSLSLSRADSYLRILTVMFFEIVNGGLTRVDHQLILVSIMV
jgi:hypothetical protein